MKAVPVGRPFSFELSPFAAYAIAMAPHSNTFLPTLIVVLTGIVWGGYWVPVRAMEQQGVTGAWGSLFIAVAALFILIPIGSKALRDTRAGPLAIFAVFIGGAGFIMYSVGFVFGRVAIVIVLFFLTPVWSTLIAKYLLGWETPRLRIYAVGVGLAGLMIMLSAGGTAPIPQNIGEWMALASGITWSVATTMMRVRPPLKPQAAALVFVAGATTCAALMAPFLSPFPAEIFQDSTVEIARIAFLTGGVFWVLTLIVLLWAVPQLDPARVGILLMAEVLIGTLTAAWFAGEHVSAVEVLGGTLVLVAGVLEVWPVKPREG